jgi:thiol-disulfide isomerase/thioredoxin
MRSPTAGRGTSPHPADVTAMKPFSEFAADLFITALPELAPYRYNVVEAAAFYLVRFDTFISADYVQESLAGFFRRVADAVGWSIEESRRVSLRSFHEASRRYFSVSWDNVSAFVDANNPTVQDVRRKHARRMDIITNCLGPNENAVRAVDGLELDFLLSKARQDSPVVLKVFADYCSVCAKMAPSFEAAARALYPKFTFASLNGPRNLSTAKELQCTQYPSVLKFLSPDGKPARCTNRGFTEGDILTFATKADTVLWSGGVDGTSGVPDSSKTAVAATPVDHARSISAETDPDPAGGLMGQWARMLRRQGIDELEALVADRDVAMHSKTDDALACDDEEACPVALLSGEVDSEVEPVVILLGGGMGSGKSGSMHSLSQTTFWKERGPSVVVVEADAFKHADPMYAALNAIGVEASRAVHSKSLESAEQLFLKAVQLRRDVVMDGTLAWRPFVEQTLSMLRDNEHFYSRGPGYKRWNDGTVFEQYWVRGERRDSPALPYRIEIVGVTVDPAVAVERGMVRKLLTGRGVPIQQQLASHRQFSENFEDYMQLVDGCYLFDISSLTNSEFAAGPKVSGNVAERAIIASKSGILFSTRGGVRNVEAYRRFLRKTHINVEAKQASELFSFSPADISGSRA